MILQKRCYRLLSPMVLCFYRSGALDYFGLGKYQTGLGGQRMKSLIIQPCNVEAVGVEFQPYGVRRFFPMSSMDFYGSVCFPQDLSDKELIILEEQILSALDIGQCWELLNNFFYHDCPRLNRTISISSGYIHR